jgi:hypothetical protein
MTKKENNNSLENAIENYHKLSIQVSLNGLSFCVLDSIANTVVHSQHVNFGKELSPYEVQKELKELLREHRVLDYGFSEVVVIHRNNLFSMVPKALFDKNELANYLKFNAKILANDLIAYDELESYDMVNVYVPFININNYIYDLFGEFEFKHNGTVLVQTLLNIHSNGNEAVCYVHVAEQQMEITVLNQKKLLCYNSFNFITKEDFIYYLLFTMEQLKLEPETVKLRLFGTITEEDPLYAICYEYVQNISIFIPTSQVEAQEETSTDTIDFTLLNAL